ncbi:MAG TPA: hypothetical protein VLA98_10280 [Solirubrobacteraceae bacterium]|nr:hypothetical protein [Solirubrobacteraceae bacterium]
MPSASATLGTLRYDTHAVAVTVELRALPGVNACTVTLPAGVRFEAAPGDPAAIELDGGEGAETVLTGTVRAVRASLHGIRVVAADGSADLAALRPAATYERQDAGAVIRALASDAGADLGRLDVDLALAAYVADQARTAAQHVAALAELAGALATVDAGGALSVAPAAPAADVALRHGRELLAVEVDDRPAAAAAPVPVGFGPAGTPSAPGALRHTAGALPSGAPAAGPDAVRLPAALLRSPGAATAAGLAATGRQAALGRRLRARAFLLPSLRPGAVLDVQDLPDHLAGGPWLVTAVVHRLAPRAGGTTTLEARAAGGGAGGLVAAGPAAVGGLL